jgi:23S rRNA (pseudouridine1915-N3)-methyltransferase
MYKIKILTTGKVREDWLDIAISEYLKRLKPQAEINFQIARDDQQLAQWIQKEAHAICLDAQGELMSSDIFSKFLHTQLIQSGSRLCFVIGGAEGLPASIKASFPLISLSPMTFTHHMVRLILIEQLYRAFEIAKGSRYHK